MHDVKCNLMREPAGAGVGRWPIGEEDLMTFTQNALTNDDGGGVASDEDQIIQRCLHKPDCLKRCQMHTEPGESDVMRRTRMIMWRLPGTFYYEALNSPQFCGLEGD
jgi:hypothetical protein